MASVSGISGTAGVSAGGPVPSGAAFAAAEQVLGMSNAGLRVALQSGRRLMDIAATKGMDRATFITQLSDAINKDRPDLGSVLATAMASRAVGGAVQRGPEIQAPGTEPAAGAKPEITELPHSAQPAITEMPATAKAENTAPTEESLKSDAAAEGDAEGGRPDLLESLSGVLNMSKRDLVSTWSGGATPIQIAESRGVAASDLLNTFESALRQSGSVRLSSRAEALARSLAVTPLTQGSLVSQHA
jgi:hypothetical protein